MFCCWKLKSSEIENDIFSIIYSLVTSTCTAEIELTEFILDFDLRQLNSAPTRLTNTMDFVLAPPRFHDSVVSQLPPFTGSDHMA